MRKKILNIRITPEEEAILAAYAKRRGRTKTDLIREIIRSLREKPNQQKEPSFTVYER
jgi:predicted DNA-binding protein